MRSWLVPPIPRRRRPSTTALPPPTSRRSGSRRRISVCRGDVRRKKRAAVVWCDRLNQLALTRSAERGKDNRAKIRQLAGKWREAIFYPHRFFLNLFIINGCPGWDRTSDQVINSHLLCH